MHPAPSLIAFTTLSGLGFGLIFWLGLGLPDATGWVALTFATIAMGLATAGLLSSLFHLGNPQRFMKALTQWRSSWLSREGVLAVVTLTMFALYTLLWVWFDMRFRPLGLVCGGLALATVYCTAMIYAQMKGVPRWHSAFVPLLFLGYALGGGALLAGQVRMAGPLLLLLTGLQILAWWRGDGAFARAGTSLGTATGLGDRGVVRPLEPPQTGTNYLLDEMAYRVARRRSRALRLIAILGIGLVPGLGMLVLPTGHALALLFVLAHLLGTMAARWLFYAEAEHVVGLYYGRR
ncbi:dimethyl sulfoxide reductase anchor subunit family protein [Oceanomicrobium pacificus]|uniref:Dimethyl sulfoxide reductase anchor subunit n=1 Tax=Oceanomicrobium pacificus TaxID=2692916 RepID=A0A6B0TPI0_9RHOB|nr:DmsC/YnfH family molybdoenzyme membrane anchor subunit [Oceanomicrobium pacificus]MXU66497.1 dimethyl sulfoxide reductase anchor subunit [Oceanomicrobium pacificus]